MKFNLPLIDLEKIFIEAGTHDRYQGLIEAMKKKHQQELQAHGKAVERELVDRHFRANDLKDLLKRQQDEMDMLMEYIYRDALNDGKALIPNERLDLNKKEINIDYFNSKKLFNEES
jgi:Skp family chaperone for outer membrane proteins